MNTLRQRIDALGGFREKVQDNPKSGKMSALYEWLGQAVNSIEHYGKTMLSNPKASVKSVVFLMRQTAMVEELLEPLERIMDDSMSVDDFIATRKNMFDNAVRNLAPSFSNTNMAENIYEISEFQVRQQILNLLNA